MRTASLSLFAIMLSAASAFAGDGATLVFKSGQVVYLNYGYQVLATAMSNQFARGQTHAVVELAQEGSSSLVNISEVVVLCRDRCKNLEVIDFRDPARTPVNSPSTPKNPLPQTK